MLKLFKNVEILSPTCKGKKDILIAGNKIYKVRPAGEIKDHSLIAEIVDCEGLYGFPGLIDQHLHIIGGGGEEGFVSRIEEITTEEIAGAGVSTVVGLLGADGCTRSLESLHAKAKALELQGLTTYIYSGSYRLPAVTLTGSMERDLVLIDKVIGAGEIAIADHRSSQPEPKDLLELASQVHMGGLIGGKAGVVHIHVGDGKEGLNLLKEAIDSSDFPREQFVPTHMNRSRALFEQAVEYLAEGGFIDLTAGESAGLPVWEAVQVLKSKNADLNRVTVSSDANGSIPGGGVTKIDTLYTDILDIIRRNVLGAEEAFRLVTENAAKVLKLYPQKGAILEGADADILITDKNYNIKKLYCMGKLMFGR